MSTIINTPGAATPPPEGGMGSGIIIGVILVIVVILFVIFGLPYLRGSKTSAPAENQPAGGSVNVNVGGTVPSGSANGNSSN